MWERGDMTAVLEMEPRPRRERQRPTLRQVRDVAVLVAAVLVFLTFSVFDALVGVYLLRGGR
jgi:hypothetical protein